MSKFWDDLKKEFEDVIDKCKHNYDAGYAKMNFCEKAWMPCAHAIATGKCEELKRIYREAEDD